MPAIIVYQPYVDTEVHVSDLTPQEVAQKVAAQFEGFSSDEETTRIEAGQVEELDRPFLTVVMINPTLPETYGCGEDHDLAYILDFNVQNMKWALKQLNNGVDHNLIECGVVKEED